MRAELNYSGKIRELEKSVKTRVQFSDVDGKVNEGLKDKVGLEGWGRHTYMGKGKRASTLVEELNVNDVEKGQKNAGKI